MLTIAQMAAMATVAMSPQPAVAQDLSTQALPRGSYSRTCSGDYINRGRLYADCRDNRGNVRGTSIDLGRCTSHDIRNDNGLLACGPHRGQYERRGGERDRPGRPGPGRPGDGWDRNDGARITIYRDANFRGATFWFDGEMPNLANTGFNDAISSMRLRGDWEVCTDAYFRGQCQVFRDDVVNLERWGMNDRISSMRPVRRGRR